jgi:transposase InsO family protein
MTDFSLGFLKSVFAGKKDTAAAIEKKRNVEPDYYYVIVVAGQSNTCYGEGQALPDTHDAEHPRIKQLARRSNTKTASTTGNSACANGDIIPLDWCPHGVEDMAARGHAAAIAADPRQYGAVSFAQSMAKRLLPSLPDNAGILVVNTTRGGSAFTQGTDQVYDAAVGAISTATRWGITGGLAANGGKTALYQDMRDRTKAALNKNPRNVLLGVVWLQGEFDQTGTPANHKSMFEAQVNDYRAELNATHRGQCLGYDSAKVPFLCGDTTVYFQQSVANFTTVYEGTYLNTSLSNVHYIRIGKDEQGNWTSTNALADDPDITVSGTKIYYGSASRTSADWLSSTRNSHFSSWAHRTIIAERMAAALTQTAGRLLPGMTSPESGGVPRSFVQSISIAGSSLSVINRNDITGLTATQTLDIPAGGMEINGWTAVGFDAQKGDTGVLDGWATLNPTGATIANAVGPVANVRELQVTRTAAPATEFTRPFTAAADLYARGGQIEYWLRPTGAYSYTGATSSGLAWLGFQHSGANPAALGAGTNATFLKLYVRASATANSLDICYSIGITHTIIKTIAWDSTSYIGIRAIYTAGSPTVRFQINTGGIWGAIETLTYTIVGTGTGDAWNNSLGNYSVSTVTGTVANTRPFAIRNIDHAINPVTPVWTDSDTSIDLSPIGAPHTITLPTSAQMSDGRRVTINNGSGQAVIVNPPTGPFMIDGSATVSIPSGTSRRLIRRAYDWRVVA